MLSLISTAPAMVSLQQQNTNQDTGSLKLVAQQHMET